MIHTIWMGNTKIHEQDTVKGTHTSFDEHGNVIDVRELTPFELEMLDPTPPEPTVIEKRIDELEAENKALRAVLGRKGVATAAEVEAERVKDAPPVKEEPPVKGGGKAPEGKTRG